MHNRTAVVAWGMLLALLVAGAVVVVALSTSTGVVMGGSATVMANAEDEQPVYAQGGWIRNNSPWPITLTAVETDAVGAGGAPAIYLSETRGGPAVDGEAPTWAATPISLPYTIEGGGLRHFGFAMLPSSLSVASFDTLRISFSGPLGFAFSSSHSGLAMVASASDLPFPLAAQDPAQDRESLDAFLAVYRDVFQRAVTSEMQLLMGPGATEEGVAALRESQVGYLPEMVFSASKEPDSRSQRVVFYLTDPEVDAIAPLMFTWADYRWTVSAAE